MELDYVKQLENIPPYLEGVAKHDDCILEMGNLTNFRRVMNHYTDFKDASSLESMNRGKWSGVSSWDKYITLLEDGDEKVMNKIKLETGKSIAELGKKYEEELTNYKFDVVGQFFDVGLVLTGVPETWLEPETVETEKPKVDFILNGTFPDGSDLDTVIENSGRLLAMAKVLEDHDVQVSIKIVVAVKGFNRAKGWTNKQTFITTDVKGYDEPINYAKCSALISPTYLRRGMMKMMELIAGYKLNGNYGKRIKMGTELLKTEQINKLEKKLFRKGK